ncbi:uncharacterized protein LOC124149749 [Haliotis rufescens]|uniref:uncharacterized protein LOC124149749 n=1 Tax=Haliotis rufescens TaxID=6454 RepID=UPI001EB06882|nr:uncharacterized protein LOC124149749 [Haliotis rufescens]
MAIEIPSSTYVKLALLCFVVGFVIQIVAFASPYWFQGDNIHGGLWLVCGDGACDAIPDNMPGVFHWVQALEAIALIFSLLAIGIVTWYLCGPCPFRIRLCQSFFVTAGALTIIGAVTFLAKIIDDKAWAVYLEFPAGVGILLAGFLSFLEYKRLLNTSEYQPVS